MAQVGDVVRGDNKLMKVIQRYKQYARCCWIDLHGTINTKWFDLDAVDLIPLEVAMGAKSLWPETGNLDAVVIGKEEAIAQYQADQERKARQREARRLKKARA